MDYLQSQEEFEQLTGVQTAPAGTTLPLFTVIYFTATWCGACRNLDMNALVTSNTKVNWLKCDIDRNDYTAGYCGIRSIPTFLIVADKKILGTVASNQTDVVMAWIEETYNKWKTSN